MGQKISCGIIHSKNGRKISTQLDKTEKMKDIMTTFFLSDSDVSKLHSFFRKKLDVRKTGFISLPYLYIMIKESSTKSDISPFLNHLFSIIDKKYKTQVSFEEFLPFLVSFCISSTYQLIEFVFNLIDTDHNKFIAIEQIAKLLSKKEEEGEIFFLNHAKELKKYKSKSIIRSDKVSLDEFVQVCYDLPFIYYPAVKLQRKLRENYINESFWKKLEKNIKKKYIDNLTKKEDLKLQVNIDDIRNKVIDERIKNFKKRWENEQKEKFNREIYKQEVRLQVPRKNSDTEFFLDKFKKNRDLIKEASSTNNIDINESIDSI